MLSNKYRKQTGMSELRTDISTLPCDNHVTSQTMNKRGLVFRRKRSMCLISTLALKMILINYTSLFSLILNLYFIQCEKIHLEKISSLYIPSSYTSTGSPVYSLEGGAAEQSAYDATEKLVYIVGKLF